MPADLIRARRGGYASGIEPFQKVAQPEMLWTSGKPHPILDRRRNLEHGEAPIVEYHSPKRDT